MRSLVPKFTHLHRSVISVKICNKSHFHRYIQYKIGGIVLIIVMAKWTYTLYSVCLIIKPLGFQVYPVEIVVVPTLASYW